MRWPLGLLFKLLARKFLYIKFSEIKCIYNQSFDVIIYLYKIAISGTFQQLCSVSTWVNWLSTRNIELKILDKCIYLHSWKWLYLKLSVTFKRTNNCCWKFDLSLFSALLKNLISSAELTKILMTLDLNNLTLLTSLKKLIISKDSDLQRSALYVLSCILSWDREDYCSAVINSDIIGTTTCITLLFLVNLILL